MAERTFYDILEVSNTASSETIQAAYERLAAKFNPEQQANAGNAAARMQFDAVKQAFLTLGNTDARAQYDRKLALRSITPARAAAIDVPESFWTLPKLALIGVVVLALGGFYFKHQRDQARIEAEKAVAVAKAREAEEKARAEAEAERIAAQRERDRERNERMDAERQRRESEAAIRQVQREARVSEITNRALSGYDRAMERSEDARRRSEEARIKREEAQATMASRQQLARDKAELCRMERERYGKSISC